MSKPSCFLTAHWKNLVMLNFEVDTDLLQAYLPEGTEIDLWHGRALISLVGFQFLKTRIKGWAIPGHQNFDEVNLRFYVRRESAEGWRRGVVFLKEIVAKPAVSWVANTVYHENYITLPLSHEIQLPSGANDDRGKAAYRWRKGSAKFELHATFLGHPQPLTAGSEEEFITEHYWGYTKQPDGSTMEYQVDHPTWRIWQTSQAEFRGDARELYGCKFASVLRGRPRSALVAEGSAVTVYSGQRLKCVEPELTLSISRILNEAGGIVLDDNGSLGQSKAS